MLLCYEIIKLRINLFCSVFIDADFKIMLEAVWATSTNLINVTDDRWFLRCVSRHLWSDQIKISRVTGMNHRWLSLAIFQIDNLFGGERDRIGRLRRILDWCILSVSEQASYQQLWP